MNNFSIPRLIVPGSSYPLRCWRSCRAAVFALAAFLCGLGFGPDLPREFSVTRFSRADQLDNVFQRFTLIWGGDQEGGGPYVYPDPEHPEDETKLRGFEVELAAMLAAEIGAAQTPPRLLTAEFQQGQWDKLPLLLDGTVDLVLNGFESTPERQRDYLCSRPYYVYGLQLLTRADSPINAWEDLRREKGKKYHAGVLIGSAAETYLRTQWADVIEVETYDGNTDAMEKVKDGQLDLTLLDDCAAIFYADRFPKLKFVGRPVGQGYFVALMKRGEERLRREVDAALTRIINDGRLQKLYDRWDMSGKSQMLALRDTTTVAAAKFPTLGEVISRNLPVLLEAAAMTILLACASMPLAILVGMLVAVGRLYGPSWARWPLVCYVELIRGTPLMLQLYAIFFLLPKIGLALPALAAAIAGLVLNYSAYEAEIYRAGLQTIPRGQLEAALALGMTRRQAILRILLPQAFRIVIPPVTNDFIALFKDTSVCSVITIVELTKRYSIQALSTGAIVELAALTAILYLLMSYPLSLAARWSEARLGGQGEK